MTALDMTAMLAQFNVGSIVTNATVWIGGLGVFALAFSIGPRVGRSIIHMVTDAV
jgi:hypothetical protein